MAIELKPLLEAGIAAEVPRKVIFILTKKEFSFYHTFYHTF
jgi:hypothetical protein